MKDHGPLRLHWEGGCKGEGILQCIKPLVTQGAHKPTFAKNLMMKCHKDRFPQNILDLDLVDKEETEEEDGEEKDFRCNKF